MSHSRPAVLDMARVSREPRQSSLLHYGVWAPPVWLSVLVTAFNFPNKADHVQRAAYWEWLQSLGDVLPCSQCRDRYKDRVGRYRGVMGPEAASDRCAFSQACFELVSAMDTEEGYPGCLGSALSSYEHCRDLIE